MKVAHALFFFFAGLISYSQNTIKVTYELVNIYPDTFFNMIPEGERDLVKKQFTATKLLQLTNNGDFSIYESVSNLDITIPSSAENLSNEDNRGTMVVIPKTWILKNFSTKKTYNLSKVNDATYYQESDFPENDLIYTNAEKIIDSYKCKLAYSVSKTNANDTIKYWYTDEIPIIDAPAILNKTPGLVLMFETKKVVIYATKIEFIDEKITLQKLNEKTPIISVEKFAALKKEQLKSRTYTDENGATHKVETTLYKND